MPLKENNNAEDKKINTDKSKDLKEEIENKYSNVLEKERVMQSENVIDKNKLEEIKRDLLRQLFSSMKRAGVDPLDRGSINSFLNNLERQDPDLKNLFEVAFNYLTSGIEGTGEKKISSTPSSTVNSFKTGQINSTSSNKPVRSV